MRIIIALTVVLSGYSTLAQEPTNFTKHELLGKIIPSSHPDFLLIPEEHCSKGGIYLRAEALKALLSLIQAAADEGIELKVLSGTRPFGHQKSIWERKWARTRYMGWPDFEKAKDILTYSSMPGSSRHHWGTDVDLNSLENSYFESGEGAEVYEFLKRCAKEFGFVQVYTSKEAGRTGYEEEKWHWSFMPIASLMLEQYNKEIKSDDIRGFEGAGVADSIRIVRNYVNGISTE
jgi:LAS superfamily LD-carboxypeptidase LdcB